MSLWSWLRGTKPDETRISTKETEQVDNHEPRRTEWKSDQTYSYLTVPATSPKSYYDIQAGTGESEWLVTHYAPGNGSDRADMVFTIRGKRLEIKKIKSQDEQYPIKVRTLRDHLPDDFPATLVYPFGENIRMTIRKRENEKGEEVTFSGDFNASYS